MSVEDCDNSLGIKWNRGNFKTLGIWFSADEYEMSNINCSKKVNTIRKILNIWSCRNLTIFGKVTVLKTLVISQIINLCSIVYVPESIIDEIDSMCFEVLWGKGKKPKVKMSVVIDSIERGGIKMIHFKSMVTSLKAMWIKRILDEKNENTVTLKAKWKDLALFSAKIKDKQLLLHKLDPNLIKQDISLFYKQMLKSWYTFFSIQPKTVQEILSEKVTYNKYILIGGKVIDYNFSILAKTKITRINDLLISSRFKTKEELESKYNCNLSIWHYNSLICSIPTERKIKLKGDKGSCLTNVDINHLTINIK